MTVREMIDRLAEFPEDMHVGVDTRDWVLPVLVIAPSPSGGLVLLRTDALLEPRMS